MDIDFVGEKDIFVVVYLDDIIVFSGSYEEHFKHLKQIGLSLNPKKYFLFMEEGRLWGHIASL
jgi:hypothetical protein